MPQGHHHWDVLGSLGAGTPVGCLALPCTRRADMPRSLRPLHWHLHQLGRVMHWPHQVAAVASKVARVGTNEGPTRAVL